MSPMMPMGGAPMGPEEMMAGEPGMGPAAGGPVPAPPGPMGGDPMMDQPEPAPEELAMMIGSQIGQKRDEMHAMVDQAADADLQNVMGMIAQAAQGAQVMGPGQIA